MTSTSPEHERLRVVLATRNAHKVAEISSMVSDLPIDIVSCRDLPEAPEIVEDGATLLENAVKKAAEVSRNTGLPALADDTGLEVDALGGAPGVYSARYAGENATYEDNNRKLLTELGEIPEVERGAVFRCVVALALPDGTVRSAEGRTRGKILTEARGSGGFGYDPVFLPDGHERTYAEMLPSEKNAVSHRGKAVRAARGLLEDLLRTLG